MTLAGVLVVVGLLLFLLFLDRFIHRLRPVAVAELMAQAGREAFVESIRAAAAEGIRLEQSDLRAEPTLVVRSDRAGSIQAVDADSLVRWAREHGSELVLPNAVGDFVPEGAVLVQVLDAPAGGDDVGPELRGMIALGDERTIQQDPSFAIRILVDIAIRALSPAVNDPTTAVQILDYVGEMLQRIGTTDLTAGSGPEGGRAPGVALRTRRRDDFLALSVTEIRQYGATSIQVVRRLRALLEELDDVVLPANRPAVEDELRRLDATVAEHWGSSVDRDRASVAGRQGIGGPAAQKRS